MKKLILNWFKSVEKKNKIDLITELLTLDCTIEESVFMYERIKANYSFALAQKQAQMNKDIQLINKTISK